MEDAATAEISRSQIWQWLHHGRISADDVTRITDEEMAGLGDGYDDARAIFESIATQPEYVEFLTLPAYERSPRSSSSSAAADACLAGVAVGREEDGWSLRVRAEAWLELRPALDRYVGSFDGSSRLIRR